MRRIWSVCLTLGLAAMLCTQALAAGKAEIVRAFVHDGTLCTYLSMEGMERPVTRAEAKIGAQSFPASDRLETVRQAGAPATWLLLVDNSTSMPAFRRQAADFVESLARSGGEHTKFILATFGDAFAVAEEDVPAGELAAALETIPMDERVTRLHTAIDAALDYFEGLPREGNELRCMVVLSDAVQYDPQGGVPYEELLERVEHSDVMLHSVGLGADRESLDSLERLVSASGGLHQTIDAQTAEDAAGALAESSGGLYVTSFDLSGYTTAGGTERVSVTFASGAELICRAEAEVDIPEREIAAPPEERPNPELPVPAEIESGSGTASPAAPRVDVAELLPAIGAAGALAAAVLAAALFRRKKKSPPAEGPAGIYIRVELVRGEQADGRETQELDLRDELIIGADPACEIPVRDENAAPRHARLFSMEGAVYVEDLRAPGGTKVNGIELRNAQRLRSGDEVTIGGVGIRLKF